MYLLLAGSSDTARALIVDEFLTAHSDWKHLALEDLEEAVTEHAPSSNEPSFSYAQEQEEDDDIFGFQETFMMMIACECAKEARATGSHVIITCADDTMLEGVYSEIDEPITSIYLGNSNDAEGFDHVFNSTEHSIMEICAQMEDILRSSADKEEV